MKVQLKTPTVEQIIDLAAPYYGMSEQPEAVTTVPPPVESDQTVQRIAEILLAGWAVDKMAHALFAILPGIPLAIWTATLRSTRGSAHKARPMLAGINEGSLGEAVARSGARREINYRAAYVLHAAERISTDVKAGDSITEAVAHEKSTLAQHMAARTNRLTAAQRVARATNFYGNLLGWYLNPLLNNESECIAADGNNFRADESTVIGDPGAVHLNCGCIAGPPHATGKMVNDVIAASRTVRFAQPRRYGLRREAS